MFKILGLIRKNVTVIACNDQPTICRVNALNAFAERCICQVVLQITVMVANHNLTCICAQVKLASLVVNMARNIVGHLSSSLHEFLIIIIFGLKFVLKHNEVIVAVVDFQDFEQAWTSHGHDQVRLHVEF